VTILSRCQRYDFKRLPLQELLEHLKSICQKEGVEIEEEALALIAREAEGSVRDSLSLLDQAISSGVQTKEDLIAAFGLADRLLVEELAQAILRQDLARCFRLIDQAFAQGVDLTYLGQDLAEFFRHLLALKVSPTGTLDDLPEAELSSLRAISLEAPAETLLLLFQTFLQGAEALRRSPFPKLSLELTVARACEVGKVLGLEELLAKVGELKENLGKIAVSAPAREATSPPKLERASWEEFVSQVKERKPALGAILETVAQPIEENQFLKLEVPDGSLLTEKEYQEDLISLGREILKREIKIVTVSGAASSSPRQKLLEKPIVQEALRVLGGKISQIKVYQN
jgi:DNA polymerase-3 subunit gamma/tau